MQTSGRVHVTSLFYTRVLTLTLCSDCYSLIPVYIHHGWSRKFQNTMVIIGEGFPIFCQLIWKITEQYRRLDEKRTMVSRLHNVKACRWLARANATGSSVVCKSQQKAEIIRVRPQRWVVGSYMRYGELSSHLNFTPDPRRWLNGQAILEISFMNLL